MKRRIISWLLLSFLVNATSAVAQETQRQYLSGHGKDDAVPWKFFCTTGAQSGYWTNLAVPSNWEMQGFGTLNYHKDATNPSPERGLYEYDFTVPGDWSGRRVFLVFDGVMTDTSARVNGESVGPMHQGGFYRFRYEITKLVKPGATNRLEVAVDKHSANESVNRAERLADFWVFGGIYRPVYLEAVPMDYIESIAVDARADGTFAMDVLMRPSLKTDYIEAQIVSPDGKPVGPAFGGELKPPIPGVSETPWTSLKTRINSPHAWTAETPELYFVEVSLKRRGGEVLHRVRQRFGFRTMEVRAGDGLYVNGKRVILKGADRHSFWPDSGRCLSEAVHRLDIGTMKDMNMNAVRMSHYPPDAEFLDLCDELGLYVLDELAGWHNKYDTDIGRKLVEEMVLRDVNHPSILFWDNGNEGGFNTNLDRVFGEFDPQQRRVLHPWAPFNGVNTAHYLAYDLAQVAVDGTSASYHNGTESADTNDPVKYIYMPTEFLHGLFDGGSGAGLEDYWKMMTVGKHLGGAFFWVLEDDAVRRPDTGQMDTAGNQAPDGIVGPYRQHEGSFNTIKEIWSPIQVESANITAASALIRLKNNYSFIDARQCKFTWQFQSSHLPGQSAGGVGLQQAAASPSIAPGGAGELGLDFPEFRSQPAALALRVDDPSGRELWTWVWPLPKAGDLSAMINAPAPQRARSSETTNLIEIISGDLTVRISKQTGRLSGVSRGAQMFSLAEGPRPAIGDATLTSLRSEQDGPDWIVAAKYSGDLKSVFWRVCGNGWVQCEYKYAAAGPRDFFGVVFDYPEDHVKSKRWLGDGPYRVWKNRLRGVTFGLWENQYNNTVTGYRDWIYPEFKGCFSNVRWLQLETSEGPITLVPEKIPFVQVLTPEQPPDNLVGKTKVHLPAAGLAFLDGIPAIGTKFKDATQGGPQGRPNQADGDYSGLVSFYFGPLP